MHTCTQASLLSPLSPVSSPETVDVLRNAERLVQNAHQQIMEVSFNSALDTLDENTPGYIGQQPLDDSLMYLREMVNSKFQESNDPNTIYVRNTSPNNAASSIRKLQPDQFPVKESSGMINNPLEISAQNSEFSTNQKTKGVSLQNEKPFFKKAAKWFNIKPPEHITVFPTSTTSNLKSKTKRCGTAPCCTMTNTGVIEINGRDHLNGSIQVQTGPAVDIRRGLTIQTIENVHISPDPSSVPIYNNIATYCFQHESSTSYVDSNRNDSIASLGARDIFDARKERHIQSTDYNDVQKIVHVESTQNAVIKDSIISSRNGNQDATGTQATPSSNSNNRNNGETDSGIVRNKKKSGNDNNEVPNVRKALIGNRMHLHPRSSLRESVDNVAYLKKAVSINLTPVITSVYQEFPVADMGEEYQDREEDFEEKNVSKGDHENLSNMEMASSYNGQKFHHVQSDTDYIQRSQTCGNECETGSCSKNCERDVEYREKVKLKQALETIANIGRIRFDVKDTGVTPAKCTQICEDKHYCNADTVALEFEPLSQPERFKSALEELCKFSQKTETSQIYTDSKMYQEAIDAFVKMVFDLNTQSDSIHGSYSPDKDFGNRDTSAKRNNQSVEKAGVETKKDEVGKAMKQVKLIPEPKEVESRRRSSSIVKPQINNLSNTGRPREPSKYFKSSVPQNNQVQKDKVAQREKTPLKFIPDDEDNAIENLDLKEPCVSDLDAVLKTYRESMAAISRGTEQLSQLISHHIVKNALSAPDHIPSAPIPNSSIILGETDVEPCVAGNKRTLATPTSKLVSHNNSKIPEHAAFICQRMATADRTSMQRTCPNQIQSTKLLQQKNVRGRIPQRNCTIVSKDDTEFDNENNSVCTNATAVSTANECSSICSKSTSEQVQTLANSDEKSTPVQFNVGNDTSNSTSTSKALRQTPGNNRTQSDATQRKAVNIAPKSDEKRMMNIQYCIPESFEAPISMEVKSDEKNSSLQSDMKNQLNTYLHLENACGRDIRLCRHSNYDIHSDEPGDFDLYKHPILISGQSDNLDATNHDRNDNSIATESVLETKETEIQVFGQILNAVKNSSQFMKRFFISLFNGMEIDSIHDVVKNLEDAAVHPIVIEQLLVLLKHRNIGESSFGGNLMLTNPVPVCNDGQKNYHEPKTHDFIDLQHSVGFNGDRKTTDVPDVKAELNPLAPCPADDQKTESLDPTQREPNLEFEFNRDCPHSIHYRNSLGEEVSKNKSSNSLAESEKILNNHKTKKTIENNHDNLAMSKTTVESKSRLLEPLLKTPCDSLQISTAKDLRKAQEARQEIELCQSNNAESDGGNNMKECLTHSISSNAASKKNDSESNTEKDISFVIPHDTDTNNDEVIDLSSVEKLTSVTLKNETTGEIIGFQIESSCRNCLRLNSFTQQGNTKVKPGSDPGKSVVSNKSIRKLQNSNESTSDHANSTKNLLKVDSTIVCDCRKPKHSNAPKLESHNIPCESSLDAVNALIDSQIQSNYKQLGLIAPEGRPSRRTPDKTIPITGTTLNKKRRATQFSTTSNSPVRKSNHPTRSGGKKNKTFGSKVSENKKGFRDNVQRLPEDVKDPECKDSEKSDAKSPCPLCIRLAGKCSCHDCTNCNSSVERPKKIPPKLKKEKEKLVGSATFSRHQSGSPKRPANTPGRYSVRKELSPRPTPASLPSETNANNKNIDHSQWVAKNDKKSISPRGNLKPSSGMSSTGSNNYCSPMNRKSKFKDYSKLFKDAASDSDNLKVEDKSQSTANDVDVTATCKSTQTQHPVISNAITVCKSSGTSCEKMIISKKVSSFSPKMLNKLVETNNVAEPSVKDVGTAPYLEPVQNLPGVYTNGCCEKITVNMKNIAVSEVMKDSSTMVLQTSEICNNKQENQFNKPKTASETGTVSVYGKTCPNIFDHDSIIILQPLNELDHTFFIAKPNSVERKMIQEKLNSRFNVPVVETTRPSIHESHDHDKERKRELSRNSNSEIVKYINCVTSTMNCLKNKECQTSCEKGSHLSVLDDNEECADLCTNDEKCLRICSHPQPKIDDSSFHCREDCPQEEACLKLCSSNHATEPSLQISSININGILEKFIAENNVPRVKMPIVKDLLQELRKVEDLLKTENESSKIIFEKSESQVDNDKNKMRTTGKLVEESKPRCHAEEISHRRSVQYEEPHEKMEYLTRNRKSLVLPNVVRGLADMHPSKRLEQLKLRTADPLVSGNFNKPESDKRYSVFNQLEPGHSSIILDDPRTQAHLASIAHSAKVREGEKSSSDSSVDILQSTLLKINKKPPTTGKRNNNNAAKLNKSKRGMDADSDFLVRIDERSVNAMKSFESSDLEPGELLQVRTPFDKPIKSCQPSKSIDLEIDKVAEDQKTLSNLCANDENHAGLLRNIENTHTQKTTSNKHKRPENKYALRMQSVKAVDDAKEHKICSDKVVEKPDGVVLDTVKSIANESQQIIGKSHLDSKSQVINNEKKSKGDNSATNHSKSRSTDVKSNALKGMQICTATEDSKCSKMDNGSHTIPKVAKDLPRIINNNENIDPSEKYSQRFCNANECNSRPEIIDHFLGKTKLEDMKVDFTNNESGPLSTELKNPGDNFQRLYFKYDFTSKTTHDSQVTDHSISCNSRKFTERDLSCSNRATSKRRDQTSSDTYSEGEINLPSSCSYSLGEVRLSTPSGTTAGKSFKDPDGFTIFVTKSILDSAHSPGEILAEIQKTESDFSSSVSS